jgi:hypothetical protein
MAFVIQLSFIVGPRKQIASPGPAALHPRPPNSTPPDQTFPITLSAPRHPWSRRSPAWSLIYSRHCRPVGHRTCLPNPTSGID